MDSHFYSVYNTVYWKQYDGWVFRDGRVQCKPLMTHLSQNKKCDEFCNLTVEPQSHASGLHTFFTAGPKEARAWTFPAGAKAPQAAGEIHTDFEKGFIRAETIAYDDYIALNGEVGAKEAGKMRQEGKDYDVQDGDVMLFKFNV